MTTFIHSFCKISGKVSIFLLIIAMVSCGKSQEEVITQKETFPGYAKNLISYPGKNRVKLKFTLDDEQVDYCIIYWSNKSKSKRINKDEAKNGVIETYINDLSEGDYIFEVSVYDKNDVSGITMVSLQKVYGESYASTLTNRTVRDTHFYYDKTPILEWSDAKPGEVGLDVTYEDETGNTRRVRMENNQSAITLPEYKESAPIEYRSLYLPEKACLDTFYTAPATIPPPTYYASVSTKNIIEKSGLVGTVVSQSSADLHEDVEFSSLQFTIPDGRPMNICILRADLNGRVSLSTIMPNNAPIFAMQTVRSMAIHRDNASGGKVLAAVNADFYNMSTGVPQGVVVMEGTVVKDYLSTTDNWTYFAIKKDGKPQVGYASSLTPANYTNFQDAVGGGVHWLVKDGAKGSWLGDTREPRTAIGYTTNNIVYIVVIDGRRNDHSIGMELTDVSTVLHSLGVHQGINLDGGGSSTMVLKENGTFAVANRVSGTSARNVANGLAIILK
jgi:exopolysaccharide biosynthesis protein